ncbi:arsenosugar biosynthesis radical SAM protein ArsS [Paracrocinitomix mangrovi]|uniref:arsenosugar biosynthesis radical SAM (seleno)protein ArsS n=1 Tax=Paracrocinitomix mangrovi TaxID=2862509 RepID=UPI001C8DB2FB|nr:arsenosugar biosynthesis radical SAM (seleno)protein ArsS [Paracrocinitomix mangrovi]UKN02118.1 arsenosugar biosynthesis radical SAM protein ArsS [Paracrocinitomix mangrovi]
MSKSLKALGHQLADVNEQLEILNGGQFQNGELPTFKEKLENIGMYPLKPSGIDIFQINLGYMCNQTCKHCHVDAGPDRKEIMTKETMQQCLDIISEHQFHTVDLTGGAPEMNPDFRWFVSSLKQAGVKEIIVRCNLTIILANKKYHDLPDFFAENNVRVVSSLPYYEAGKTDRQRGSGVFDKSIKALQMLNEVGYGKTDSELILDLVYNPAGAFLPGEQAALEHDFKTRLKADFGIDFSGLLCITNLPISRFLEYLIRSENYEEYMEQLVQAFNPAAVDGIMCRNTISIDWQGYMYDCDFNQMLKIKTEAKSGQHISEFNLEKLNNRNIIVSQHCFGCTAGAGSSCQGATV